MIRSLPFVLLLLAASTLFGQSRDTVLRCGGGIFSREQQIRQDYLDSLLAVQAAASGARPPEQFLLPVVVHIIHQQGLENITDARVQTAIEHLNQAFAHSGYYATQGPGAEVPIQFCLAGREPNGLATSGIYRVESPLTNMVMETQDGELKALSRRPPQQYINIYVVASVTSIAQGAGVAGYAYLAGMHGRPADGLVCEAAYFGDSPQGDAVLIHEMGHYLNLYHTFQNACANDDCLLDGDRVCDTPPDRAQGGNCSYNSCTTDTDDTSPNNPFSSDQPDATDNFMDYSPFSCYHAFTAGQSSRMIQTLLGARASLLSSRGCGLPCPAIVQADFSFPAQGIVVGNPFSLTNLSISAQEWQWSLNGQVFSNQFEPVFVPDTAGIYNIVLTVDPNDPACYDIVQHSLSVACAVQAAFTLPASLLDLTTTLQVTNMTVGADSFVWRVNGLVVSTLQNFAYVFPEEGLYVVSLTAYGGTCSTERSQVVRVFNLSCPSTVGARSFEVGIHNSDYLWMPVATDNGDLYFQHYDSPNSTVIKTDSVGSVLWKWKVKLQNNGLGNFVLMDDGGIIFPLASETSSSKNRIAKLNADGSLAWIKQFSFHGGSIAADITLYKVGNAVVAYSFSATNTNFEWAHILKIHSDGTLLLNKDLEIGEGTDLRGAVVQAASNDDYWLVGFTQNNAGQQHGLVLLRFNAQGKIVTNRVARLNDGRRVRVNSALALADGGFLLCGTIVKNSPVNKNDVLLWRLDSTGLTTWVKSLWSPGTGWYETASDLALTPSGDIQTIYQNILDGTTARLTFSPDGVILAFDKAVLDDGATYLESYVRIGDQMRIVARNPSVSKRIYLFKTDPTGKPIFCGHTEPLPFNTSVPVFFMDTLVYKNKTEVSGLLPTVATLLPHTEAFMPRELCVRHPACPEICFNGLDDDTDGLIDCADPDCVCLPDAKLQITAVSCGPDSLEVAVDICNNNLFVLPAGTPIAIYAGDPRIASAVQVHSPVYTSAPIRADTCMTIQLRVPTVVGQAVFVVVNDDGSAPVPYNVTTQFPVTAIQEGNYLNNFASFSWSFQAPPLDLGPDQTTCANSVRVLHAGAGFAAYRWQDGSFDSTFTAYQPGIYWVDAQDSCGAWHADTIRLLLQAQGSIELGADRVICPQGSVHLALPAGPVYSWEPAAGLDCHSCSAVVAQPVASTTYYVTAASGDCLASDSIRITVAGQVPVADFSFQNQPNGQVNFSNSSLFAQQQSWDFGDGSVSAVPVPSHVYTDAGQYMVTLTVWNDCDTVQTSQVVLIGFVPTAGFTVAGMVQGCGQASTVFENQSSVNTQTFHWEFPGGTPVQSTMASPTVTYAGSGTYTATLIVRNDLGADTVSKTLEVIILPLPVAEFSTSMPTVNSVQCLNLSQSAASQLWDFGDGMTSAAFAPAHVYSTEGQYVVTLTVWNDCDTVQTSQLISIVFLPQAAFFVPDTIRDCGQATVTFDNLSANAQTYQWTFPGASPEQSMEATPTVQYAFSGNYAATLVAGNSVGLDTVTANFQVEVSAFPFGDFSFVVQADGSVQFSSTTQFGEQLLWNFGDGSTSSEANPVHSYALSGNYLVTLSISNFCGASVLQYPVNIVLTSTTQTGNIPRQQVIIYPNPSAGEITIDASRTGSRLVEVQVLDVQGRLLMSSFIPASNRCQLRLPEGAAGLYLIRLQLENGVYYGKVVRE